MYASPEYLLGGAIDARSDLFSLGLVLREALTNRHLFGFWLVQREAPETQATQGMRAEEEPDLPLQQLLALVERCTQEDVEHATAVLPEGLRALLRRALQRVPAGRHATAEELGRELRVQLHALLPGYGRKEAAEDMAHVIADASAMRGLGEPIESGLYPAGLDEHELMPDPEETPR